MRQDQLERMARRELPAWLAETLGEPEQSVEVADSADQAWDLAVRAGERVWLFEVKAAGTAGSVAAAAASPDRSRPVAGDVVSALVVPYMTAGGRRAALERGVNWIDLSGNAWVRGVDLAIKVEGRPNRFPRRGRPSSAFAPKSARVARVLLSEPDRWWRQRDLVEVTGLDDGHMSRVIRKLGDDDLLDRHDGAVRPRDPLVLLDAWADEYQFERHHVTLGHVTGTGMDVVKRLSASLEGSGERHAFTGLSAAWMFNHFAQFRLCSVYVSETTDELIERIGLRRNERGANVQLLEPDDDGVFYGASAVDGVMCVGPAQTYLDLQHLPERSAEAAGELRRTMLSGKRDG